jgi:hypothetical protein
MPRSFWKGLGIACAAMACGALQAQAPAPAQSDASQGISSPHATADFGTERPSAQARAVADWVARSRDNHGIAFLIVDKKAARLLVFDASARVRGTTPILLGAARGDHSVPGIGTRPLSQVKPEERTTPAGRFVAERGRDLNGDDVVWLDYDAAVSMHRVVTSSPRERRLQRLATPTVTDNRISYGCINVPVAFYEKVVRPIFATHRAMVYVLPDTLALGDVFPF